MRCRVGVQFGREAKPAGLSVRDARLSLCEAEMRRQCYGVVCVCRCPRWPFLARQGLPVAVGTSFGHHQSSPSVISQQEAQYLVHRDYTQDKLPRECDDTDSSKQIRMVDAYLPTRCVSRGFSGYYHFCV